LFFVHFSGAGRAAFKRQKRAEHAFSLAVPVARGAVA